MTRGHKECLKISGSNVLFVLLALREKLLLQQVDCK